MLEYVGVRADRVARADAVAFSADGPRVLVCGSTDAGKSSFAASSSRTCARPNPIFVDLDGRGGRRSRAPFRRRRWTGTCRCRRASTCPFPPLFFGHTAPSKNLPILPPNVEQLLSRERTAVAQRRGASGRHRREHLRVGRGRGYGCSCTCRALSCDVVLVSGPTASSTRSSRIWRRSPGASRRR